MYNFQFFSDQAQDKLNEALNLWIKFEREQENVSNWIQENEIVFKNQQLKNTLNEKLDQLTEFKEIDSAIKGKEKDIDAFVDTGHLLLQTCSADHVKSALSQISNRYDA